MIMRRTLLVTTLVFCSLSGAAVAQRRAPSSDLNKDGMITLVEHGQVTQSRFDRMDSNGDGVIDTTEQRRVNLFMGGRNPLLPADANSDGRITRAEFKTATAIMFARADANKDGRISAAEQEAMRSPQAR
jgi:Ca2+-binding EF-hand superfamily protein